MVNDHGKFSVIDCQANTINLPKLRKTFRLSSFSRGIKKIMCDWSAKPMKIYIGDSKLIDWIDRVL